MNREKRVRAPPAHYEIPPVCYPRIRQRQKGKKTKQTSNPPPGPPQQCTYQSIPLPLKFAYVGGVYHFYGGISLHEENGVLRTQTMLLSQCFRCDEVKVIKEHDQNILSMKLFKQPIFQYPPWQPMVETLNRSENAEICRWGAPIREYCLKYEDRLRVLADQEAYRKQGSEDKLIEMNKESEKQIAEYFRNYPCINFRAQLDDNQMQFNEIIINDAYLEHVGYSIDTFAVTTLRDGLPQLLPTNNIDAVKVYIDNYCSLAQSDFQSSELTSEIILRKGFVRRVNYKAHYFATYRDGVFGMDCIWMITGRQPPTLSTTLSGTVPSEIELDKKFVKKAVKKEKQAAKFLQQYYNKQYNAKYANMDKVCRIKQIEDDSNSCIVSLNSNYVHVHDFLN